MNLQVNNTTNKANLFDYRRKQPIGDSSNRNLIKFDVYRHDAVIKAIIQIESLPIVHPIFAVLSIFGLIPFEHPQALNVKFLPMQLFGALLKSQFDHFLTRNSQNIHLVEA